MCGLVTNPVQGPEVIVAGGYGNGDGYTDIVDIFSIDANSWRKGKVHVKVNTNFENNAASDLCETVN